MRFHVLGLPHTQTTQAYSACAYTDKVRKFCMMMRARGHEVFLYAGELNEAPCTELITCISEEQRQAVVGGKHYVDVDTNSGAPHWKLFNSAAIAGIQARIQPQDFICVIFGVCQKPVADWFSNYMTVEFGIGYGGTFAKYRVFESYAWMHAVYASQSGDPHRADGRFFDAVIPNYFVTEDFPFSEEQDDNYLFMGRLIERKGYRIAADTCEHIKAPLLLAGPGTYRGYGTHVGVAGPVMRGKLMSRAKAVFVPTQYLEPFGGVAVEAMLCGTPVITTDWGAFTETVKNGFNGWRCRMFQDFVYAAREAATLDVGQREGIRKWAQMVYGLDAIGDRYEEYFTRLLTLYGKGWYA